MVQGEDIVLQIAAAKPPARNVMVGITLPYVRETEQMMVASVKGEVIYPVVVVPVSSYASNKLVNHLSKGPTWTDYKRIHMMCSKSQKIEVYDVKISNINEDSGMETEVNKVDKGILSVPNTSYAEKIKKYPNLRSCHGSHRCQSCTTNPPDIRG